MAESVGQEQSDITSVEDILQRIKHQIDGGDVDADSDVLELTERVEIQSRTFSKKEALLQKMDAHLPPLQASDTTLSVGALSELSEEPCTLISGRPAVMRLGIAVESSRQHENVGAVSDALKELKELVQSVSHSAPRENNSRHVTLESIVQRSIQPYLRSWLDEHLSDIVHKVVEREVARLVAAADE